LSQHPPPLPDRPEREQNRRIAELEREVEELKLANEVLRAVAGYFALPENGPPDC